MSYKNKKIAIIGGGVGGLAIGIGLKNLQIPFNIYEKSQTLQTGAGLVLFSNGIMALAKLGINKQVIDAGFILQHGQFMAPQGNKIMTYAYDKIQKKLGYPSIGISREKLYEVMLSQLPSDSVKWGHDFQNCVQNDEKVTIDFTNGTHVEADILIGTDGLHSKVKKQLWGDPPLRYSRQSGWRGICKACNFFKDQQFFETWGKGQRFGAVKISEEEVYWWTGMNTPAFTLTKESEEAKVTLLKQFNGWHDPIEAMIARTDTIIQTDFFDAKSMRPWYKGSVVLLGDAIHPTTPNLGQGASMALESAVVLLKTLETSSTVKEAFSRYQSKRYWRTGVMTQTSWWFGKITQLNSPFLITLRNVYLRVTQFSFNWMMSWFLFPLNL